MFEWLSSLLTLSFIRVCPISFFLCSLSHSDCLSTDTVVKYNYITLVKLKGAVQWKLTTDWILSLEISSASSFISSPNGLMSTDFTPADSAPELQSQPSRAWWHKIRWGHVACVDCRAQSLIKLAMCWLETFHAIVRLTLSQCVPLWLLVNSAFTRYSK